MPCLQDRHQRIINVPIAGHHCHSQGTEAGERMRRFPGPPYWVAAGRTAIQQMTPTSSSVISANGSGGATSRSPYAAHDLDYPGRCRLSARSLRWSGRDGWRLGLIGRCGFDPPKVLRMLSQRLRAAAQPGHVALRAPNVGSGRPGPDHLPTRRARCAPLRSRRSAVCQVASRSMDGCSTFGAFPGSMRRRIAPGASSTLASVLTYRQYL